MKIILDIFFFFFLEKERFFSICLVVGLLPATPKVGWSPLA